MMWCIDYQWHDDQHSQNSTLQTSHSLVVKRPLALPVKEVLESAFLAYLKLLQLMGNSALDFSTLDLSTMQMSQQPKMGPFSGLQAMANWARLSPQRSLRSMEKMKEVRLLSAAQCFLLEFQGSGVQPPMTLSYSVSMTVSVCGTSSQALWNSLTEKFFSLARQSRLNFFTFCLRKSDLMKSYSWITRSILLSMSTISGAELTEEKVESLSSFYLGISLVQMSLMFSRRASICFWTLAHSSKLKLVSICLDSFMKRAEMILLVQTPEMLLQVPSLMRLMKFMVSCEQPQSMTHFLKFMCSSLTFLMRVEKKLSIYSWKEQNSGSFALGFSQIMFSSSLHIIFSHPSWNSPQQLFRLAPASHRNPGRRQFWFMQIIQHRFPYMHSGVCFIGLFIIQYIRNTHSLNATIQPSTHANFQGINYPPRLERRERGKYWVKLWQ